ncbi:MAG: class I adenylate-forming enzyme family protein [Clostridia bacterium]|nr:class I adenylate-forming enzyme family protein [Clostridia bacterium]
MYKKETDYPSIDRTHEKDEKYFDVHPIIPSLSIYNAIKLISSLYKKENAIDCLELNISYEELISKAATLSKAFKELGIKAGEIITVSMPNFYQAVLVYLAANRIGAVTTFLNPFASVEEIEGYLNLFESPLFINYDKNNEYNERIKKNTKIRQIVTLSKKDLNNKKFADSTSITIGNSDYLSFSEMGLVADYYKKPFKTLYGGDQESLILFTSGTTGNPKAVVLTNRNILSSGLYMKNSTHLTNTKGEKSLVCVPFTYPYGFATSTLMSLLCGREAILAPNLTDENISYFLSKNPNIVFGSPALLELIKRNIPTEQDLSSIHTFISGGDFLTPSQANNGIDFFRKHNANVVICNGSGNAETVGANTNAVGLENKPETVGRILLGSSPIIIDQETGEELKYGEEGLLCISGKHVFKKYFNEPELTEKAKFYYKGKEYFRTGTRGFLDKDGYFTLTGRDSRFYIISTLNKIYCDYVQNIMSIIDIVDACAVVKKPNDEMLYTGKAFVVLKDGIVPTDEIKDYILSQCALQLTSSNGEKFQLKPYEIPTSIEFVKELPRTQADKIDYPILEHFANEEYEKEKGKAKKLTL